MEIASIVAIVFGGIFAGIVNTLVGGGTSIVVPLLLALGIDPQLANGTNRFCVAFQAGAAAKTFRGKTGARSKQTLTPVLCAVAGAIPGAYLATILDPELFRDLLGWLLLAGVLLFFAPKKKPRAGKDSETETETAERLPLLGLVVTFFFGVYGGFFGAGIGVLILLYLPPLLKLPLVRMVEVKVWLVFALSAAAGVVYLLRGQVDLPVVLALLPSYVLGGILGAKLALGGGEVWIRRAIAVVAAALAVAILTGVI